MVTLFGPVEDFLRGKTALILPFLLPHEAISGFSHNFIHINMYILFPSLLFTTPYHERHTKHLLRIHTQINNGRDCKSLAHSLMPGFCCGGPQHVFPLSDEEDLHFIEQLCPVRPLKAV
jgi:hypothetical protein